MERRTFIEIAASGLGIAALGDPFLLAQDSEHQNVVFPFGTHVYREPSLPLEQIRADLPLLKHLGFNMIKIQESWAVDERKEGEISLDNVLRVVSDARDNGLNVYFGVTMEQAPAWLWQKYPDAYLVYNTGEQHFDQLQYVIPADGKPGPCWHHPGAREAATRFLKVVGREVGRFDNVLVWNVWQEIGFWPMRPGKLGFCYCANSLREFRSWLQVRYGSIAKLNDAWKSGYASFEEATPPRMAKDLPPQLDFRYFMDDVYISDVLCWKAEALRASDPVHRPVFAHSDAAMTGSGQQWRHAESLDFFGGSCYPAWRPFESWDAGQGPAGGTIDPTAGRYAELWSSILLRFDYLRCATPGGKIWAAEFQGGPVVRGLHRRRVPDAADIQRWILGSLAAGVQGICFWNHRAEIFWREEFGFGLLELEGNEITPRAAEAGRLAKAVNRHAALFSQGLVPQAEVAILISEELFHFHEATHSEEYFAAPVDHLAHTIRGTYKSLWDHGIALDFLEESQLAKRGLSYKVLFLPFPVSLKPSLIASLRDYVQQGGVVVSEACPGRLSEYGLAAPGAMPPVLRELFGVTHQDVVIIREPKNGAIWTGNEQAYGDTTEYRDLHGTGPLQGQDLMPAYVLQTINRVTAMAILQDDDRTVGSVHSFGKGSAYLIGTLLGHATLSYNDSRNGNFLAALLKQHGVFSDRIGKLQRRRRIFGKQAAWFLFNTTESPVEESVPLEGFSEVSDLFSGALSATADRVRVAVNPMSIRCLLLRS
jgi:beta-galactosidase